MIFPVGGNNRGRMIFKCNTMSSLRDCSHGWIDLTTKYKYKLSQCLTTQPPLNQAKKRIYYRLLQTQDIIFY